MNFKYKLLEVNSEFSFIAFLTFQSVVSSYRLANCILRVLKTLEVNFLNAIFDVDAGLISICGDGGRPAGYELDKLLQLIDMRLMWGSSSPLHPVRAYLLGPGLRWASKAAPETETPIWCSSLAHRKAEQSCFRTASSTSPIWPDRARATLSFNLEIKCNKLR